MHSVKNAGLCRPCEKCWDCADNAKNVVATSLCEEKRACGGNVMAKIGVANPLEKAASGAGDVGLEAVAPEAWGDQAEGREGAT